MSPARRIGVGWAAALILVLAPPATGAADSYRDFMVPRRVRPSPLDHLTPDGRPTADAIAVLRAHVGGRVIRVGSGGVSLEGRDARLDSLGIEWEPAGTGGAAPRALPWAGVDRLETRRSNALRGLVFGAFAGTLAMVAVSRQAGSDPGPGIVVVFALPPAGAALGGLVGSTVPRWQHEWPPASRPPRTDR